jgi:catechol 2,3-dioxygenase-like lactoylglutathione lyase family enzyme
MSLPLLSVVHCNVNCSDLARSKAFYEQVIGLEARSHTAPEKPQDCRAFGFAGEGQWDAWILDDARGSQATGVDLLEWKLPPPTGRPHAEPNHVGFAQLGFAVSDLSAVRAAAPRMHGSVVGPIRASGAGADGARQLQVRDPDGTRLELLEQPGSPTRFARVTVNCRELSHSLDWYEAVLGAQVLQRGESASQPGAAFGLEGDVAWRFASLRAGRMGGPAIDYPAPNHLGIFRMAFLVEDARACYAELRERGVECPPPVWLEMGPEIPVDGLWAVFFPDPDGTLLELIQAPVMRA